MRNMGEMLRQAQQMQQKMTEMQNRLGEIEVEGEAGAGLVRVKLTGKLECRRVQIDPKLVSGGDAEMLEDLVAAAFNDAKAKAEAMSAKETEAMMGGIKLPPGIKLPF